MAIFLLILKIIGIILLSVLGLLLFLVLLVLFVPVRYSLYSEKKEKGDFYLKAKITYLLHMATVCIASENNYEVIIRIFGIKLRNKKPSGKDEKKDNAAKETIKEVNISSEAITDTKDAVVVGRSEYTVDWNDEEHIINSEVQEQIKTDEPDEVVCDCKEDDCSEECGNVDVIEDEDNLRFSQKLRIYIDKISLIVNKIIELYNNASVKFNNLTDTISNKSKKLSSLYKMMSDYRNKRALSQIWKQMSYIFKKVLPRVLRIKACIGFEDPATTGSILATIGFLAPIIPGQIEIMPRYDENVIEGDVYLKGKVTLYILLVVLWRLIFDKDVRRLWKIYRGKTSK